MEEDVVLSLFLGPSLVYCSFCDTQEGHSFGLRELLVEYCRYPNGHFTFIASLVNGYSLIVKTCLCGSSEGPGRVSAWENEFNRWLRVGGGCLDRLIIVVVKL